MAHVIVEWTDNLAAEGFDVKPLLSLIASAMRNAGGVFPLGGIRIRGIRLEDYVIADDTGEDAFINVTVLMGSGRSAEFKSEFFGRLFSEITAHLEAVFTRRFLALSMYINEADEAGSFKHNNIHTRFRKDG